MTASRAFLRMLAARRPPPVPRSRKRLQHCPIGVEAHIARLSEAERSQVSKHLDIMGEELQSKLVQGVDAYLQRPTILNSFNRVPTGERREKLIWRSSLAGMFLASWQPANGVLTMCAILL